MKCQGKVDKNTFQVDESWFGLVPCTIGKAIKKKQMHYIVTYKSNSSEFFLDSCELTQAWKTVQQT